MKRVTVLGATGSVGRARPRAVYAVHRRLPDRRAGRAGLEPRPGGGALPHPRPKALALIDDRAIDRVSRALPHPRPEILAGPRGLRTLAREVDADVVLSAIVGGRGSCRPWLPSSPAKAVAIANKEPLVMAGSLMTAAARRSKVPLLPVDSEHSAIFQCLEDTSARRCTGSSSRPPAVRSARRPRKPGLGHVEDALNHPTWKMAPRSPSTPPP